MGKMPGLLSMAACLLLALSWPLRLQAQGVPPPPPPPPSAQTPPILVPAPAPVIPAPVGPGAICPALDPAPSTNPFWPVLPPPAGPPLIDTPPLLVDFWAIGRHNLSGSDSQFTQSKLSIAYDFRYPIGPVTLGARPEFDVMFLAGPTPPGPDLPPQVYALSVALEAEFRVSPTFSLRASFSPGLYTDFSNVSGHAFRFPVQATGAYALSPQLTIVGGVMYTAQPRWSVLPVAGVVWRPMEDWHLELTFPRLRVVHHLGDGIDVYGLLDLYGDTYAFRANGQNDLMQYRDLRLGVGAEWTTPVRVRLFFEAGGAFARRLDFENQPNQNINSGLYLRVGGRF
jgi:hypothetical protein